MCEGWELRSALNEATGTGFCGVGFRVLGLRF